MTDDIMHIRLRKQFLQQNNNISQAIPIIEAEIKATKERDDILQFVLNSKRGLMKGYN